MVKVIGCQVWEHKNGNYAGVEQENPPTTWRSQQQPAAGDQNDPKEIGSGKKTQAGSQRQPRDAQDRAGAGPYGWHYFGHVVNHHQREQQGDQH